MKVVLIVPTGIGAEIGGHAGDANPVCKLMAEVAETVVTHPNVVNASDINEMPENVFYVEGSMLDRFMMGGIRLRQPLQNRILVVANPPVGQDTRNAVAAAQVTIGVDTTILELKEPLRMVVQFKGHGRASGDVRGWRELVEQVKPLSFDALAIHTPIEVGRDVALDYFNSGGVNPWGGVEAVASRLISTALNKPVAHAPQETVTADDPELWNVLYKPVDPRMAPEVLSSTYLHSVLKGLNRAPRVARTGLGIDEIDALISPHGCWGRPHIAARAAGISIIAVRENRTIYQTSPDEDLTVVENYWEAAGLLMCMKAGITPASVRRPI